MCSCNNWQDRRDRGRERERMREGPSKIESKRGNEERKKKELRETEKVEW